MRLELVPLAVSAPDAAKACAACSSPLQVVVLLHLVPDDIRAVRDDLRSRGVDVQEVEDLGGVLFAYFADPDAQLVAAAGVPAPGMTTDPVSRAAGRLAV